MLPNTAAMFECHFGVPMIGAVLNTLNTRLDAEAIAFMLDHGEAKVLITDLEFSKVIKAALELLDGPKPLVIDVPRRRTSPTAKSSARRTTRPSWPKGDRTSPGSCRPTSGTPSR